MGLRRLHAKLKKLRERIRERLSRRNWERLQTLLEDPKTKGVQLKIDANKYQQVLQELREKLEGMQKENASKEAAAKSQQENEIFQTQLRDVKAKLAKAQEDLEKNEQKQESHCTKLKAQEEHSLTESSTSKFFSSKVEGTDAQNHSIDNSNDTGDVLGEEAKDQNPSINTPSTSTTSPLRVMRKYRRTIRMTWTTGWIQTRVFLWLLYPR